MRQVTQQIYQKYFGKVYDWFEKNVHVSDCKYEVLNLPNTEYKLIELLHPKTGTVLFRVIIKMTFDPIDKTWKPERTYEDIDYLFNTKTDNPLFKGTSPQLCYIQIDADGNAVGAILYTYSPDDEEYHTFLV